MANTVYVDGCVICAILLRSPREYVVLRTKWWKLTLNPNQSYLGRVWVTLTEHRGTIPDLTADQLLEFQSVTARYAAACQEAFGADLVNWSFLTNNAYQEDRPLPHAHWHGYPRYSHRVTVAGVAFEDTRFGLHYDPYERSIVDDATLREIHTRLTEALL